MGHFIVFIASTVSMVRKLTEINRIIEETLVLPKYGLFYSEILFSKGPSVKDIRLTRGRGRVV